MEKTDTETGLICEICKDANAEGYYLDNMEVCQSCFEEGRDND